MPKSLVKRSEEILIQLEDTHRKDSLSKPLDAISTEREGIQLMFLSA
jgi:DNA mismatch repair protein MutS